MGVRELTEGGFTVFRGVRAHTWFKVRVVLGQHS
jgi:hypothetical protein